MNTFVCCQKCFKHQIIDNDYTLLFNTYLNLNNNNIENNIYEHCDTTEKIVETLKNASFDSEYYLNAYSDLSVLQKTELENHFVNNGCYEGRFCNKSICNTLNYPKYCSGTIFISRSEPLLSFFDVNTIDFILHNMKNNMEYGRVNDNTGVKHSHCIERMFGLVNYMYWQCVYGI
jgi:hypothetical protein